MKCPKCHYLSFEPEPRCRNCGYDLSLSPAQDLELRTPDPYEGPLMDLTLRGSAADEVKPRGEKVVTLGPIDLDRVVGLEKEDEQKAAAVPAGDEDETDKPGDPVTVRPVRVEVPPLRVVPAPEPRAMPAGPSVRPALQGRRRRPPSTTAELPLFVKKRPEPDPDAPLVSLPATPTPPIAVRRAHEPSKPRRTEEAAARSTLGPFERDLLGDLKRLERRVVDRAREESLAQAPPAPNVTGRRLAAAAIDALLLGSISASVLWATLRVCDLGLGQAATLPIVPLTAFLLLVAAGYLLMFTVAGGQTVGKMLMRIRVVGTDDWGEGGLRPAQAAMRAVLTLPSVLMLGLGFLPALAGQGLAMHDRLSHTRVVPA